VLDIYLWSRAASWVAAIFAFFFFEPNRHPNADRWDTARLHDLGYFTDVWARWDSDFFLHIAQNGYDDTSAAFHPLYPALIAGLGRVFFGHYVLAGVVISLLCCLGSFVLLYRLADEHLGAEGAERSVLYLAVFPMALFLQAVYSESLFLLLVLGAFALAERNRFAGAGLVPGRPGSRSSRRSPCWPGTTATACAPSPASRWRCPSRLSIRSCFGSRSATRGRSRTRRTAGTGTSRGPALSAESGTVSSQGGVAWNSSSSGTAHTFPLRIRCTRPPRTCRRWRFSPSS
jgi:hypothetical protein